MNEKNRKAAYDKAYYAIPSNRAKRAARTKIYQATHREKIAVRTKIYHTANREKCRIYGKIYQAAHREQIMAHARQRIYGLSPAAYHDLLSGQGGICKICGTSDWGHGGPHVDHNHATGKVRGLLCHNCNAALGLMRDDLNLMQAGVDYLLRNAEGETE